MILYSKKTINKALRRSKIKWADMYHGHNSAAKKCPLCDMFFILNDCRLCPVMNKTGLPKCKGTPYVDWINHRRIIHGINGGNEIHCKDCTKFAERQFLFLSKLLKDQR